MTRTKAMSLLLLATLSLGIGAIQAGDKPSDAKALQGITQGRVVFDINISQPNKLPLYLMVIDQTITDLEAQGVQPEVILAFRGKAVTLISTDHKRIDLADIPDVEKAAEQLAALQQRGVRIEACSVATSLSGVDNATLLPGIEPVGNTFVSLIGYQAQGYATIPIY